MSIVNGEYAMKDEKSNPLQNDVLHGNYANYFKVGYNAFEFIIDFCQCYEDEHERHLFTRVVTSPVYAKALFETLQKSLYDYEQSFGVIKEKSSIKS
ncbi:hypothetical protein U27_02282 [Candidatus Vecturithrix granuli]|uniref:DUF3467 domain-containing protein n=1 Tax=Vecturithrix granuli TaxID=1499967 RepID=A0A0S6W726_VECG1|nr:hypothetical protein U27_02282 [Candidatus Vecturithrix granuli]